MERELNLELKFQPRLTTTAQGGRNNGAGQEVQMSRGKTRGKTDYPYYYYYLPDYCIITPPLSGVLRVRGVGERGEDGHVIHVLIEDIGKYSFCRK